jgi:hypothetical protein
MQGETQSRRECNGKTRNGVKKKTRERGREVGRNKRAYREWAVVRMIILGGVWGGVVSHRENVHSTMYKALPKILEIGNVARDETCPITVKDR